jgi:hypothetical protein
MGFDFGKFSKDVNFESLTVQVQQEEAPYVSTTSNNGNVKFNTLACKILGVPYGAVNTDDKSDAGVRVDFRRQDWAGEEATLVYLHPLGSKNGSKLASPSKQNGGILQCSSSNAWNSLGGNEETLKYYTIDAADNAVLFAADDVCTMEQAVEGGMIEDGKWTALAEDNGIATAGDDVIVYYKLTFAKEEAKRASNATGRPKKAKKSEEAPFSEDLI